MSAKFLYTFADENPEFQRQTGCMTGIIQMFDRHHLLSGRRLNGHNHKRPSSGYAPSNGSSIGAERNGYSPRIVLEKSLSKSLSENQRISMESSRNSFSSSSCSSFSSLDCNKSTQEEHPSIDRIFYTERSIKDSPKLKNYEVAAKSIHCEPQGDPPNAPIQPDRRSLDFRDVVKDSMYKDTHAISVRSSLREEKKNHLLKHTDSPRPIRPSKSMDTSQTAGMDGRSRMHVDLGESLRVLVKLKEAPQYFSEANEPPRKSYEAKDTSFYLASKESPRFSCDGRDWRPSLDSRESGKISSKLRELPRLSLDSRGCCIKSSNFDSKPNASLEGFDRCSINRRTYMILEHQQELGTCKRLPSVVAKLMGLEALPSLSQEQVVLEDTNINKKLDSFDRKKGISFASKNSITQDSKEDQLSCSQKCSIKDPITPRQRKPDSIIKPISHSRVPIEPAPWRHHDKIRIPQKMTFGSREAHVKQQPESVYSEIEKKLKDLEFQQSNKDLRALKHILDAMHAKGLLENKKGEDQLSETLVPGSGQKLGSLDAQSTIVSHPTLMQGDKTPRAFESPIVIMKPAKSVNRSDISPSSVIPLEGLSGLRRLRLDQKKASISIHKDQTPKASYTEPTCQPLLSADKKYRKEENGMHKIHSRMSQVSPRPQEAPREDSGSSVKSSNSLSPRLQQRKLEIEKRSCPPLPSSQSNKPPKQPANRYSSESLSPRGRLRRKPAQAQQNDDQMSDITSRTRSLNHQGDKRSLRSDGNISLASQVDREVTSSDYYAELCLFRQGNQRPSGRAAKSASSAMNQKKKSHSSKEDISAMDLATAAPEQPSPVSVLDPSLYQDDLPPVRISSNAFNDDKIQASVDCCIPNQMPDFPSPKLSPGFDHKKLANIEHLVQKLKQLRSSDDEAPGTDHMALLCDTQNPDHRYVSEILLASGLLMRDLTSGQMGTTPIQLHPSGHPINPDLFLLLEQRKSGWLAKPETANENNNHLKLDPEKLHRKLVFDVVNELLMQKLELASPGPCTDLLLRVRKASFPSGLHLLKELCCDIEHLNAESSIAGNCDGDNNLMSGAEILRQSEGWTDSSKELQAIVLDIERSIFKDLIDEVINGECASGFQAKARSRRQTARC